MMNGVRDSPDMTEVYTKSLVNEAFKAAKN